MGKGNKPSQEIPRNREKAIWRRIERKVWWLMEQEYWKLKRNPNVVVIAYIYDNGTVQLGNNKWNDYGSFTQDMTRYGYERN